MGLVSTLSGVDNGATMSSVRITKISIFRILEQVMYTLTNQKVKRQENEIIKQFSNPSNRSK